MCGFADDRPSDAQKLAFMHQVLQRDVTEVRMFLDHLERYAASLGAAQRRQPEVRRHSARLSATAHARALPRLCARRDDAAVHTRMMALARNLGWLTPAQEQSSSCA